MAGGQAGLRAEASVRRRGIGGLRGVRARGEDGAQTRVRVGAGEGGERGPGERSTWGRMGEGSRLRGSVRL